MTQPELRRLSCQSIIVKNRLRRVLPERLDAMAESIRLKGGVQTPIECEDTPDGPRLVYGLHRLEATIHLQLPDVPALVYPEGYFGSEEDIREREITENIDRAELTALERAVFVSAWVDIYRARAGAKKPGPKKPVIEDEEELSAKFALNFTEAAQNTFGISRRAVFHARKIASIAKSLRDRIDAHPLATNQSALLLLADESADRQERVVQLILSGEATSVAEAIGIIDRQPKPASAAAWEKLSERFARLKDIERDRFFELHSEAIELWLAKRSR